MSRSRRALSSGSRRESRPGKPDPGNWVDVSGRVLRLLPDDDVDGSHQRFVIESGGGGTLLIAHNLELSDRVPVGIGDRVRVRGRFEWSEKGGTVHWTHDDPFRGEAAGYICLRGTTYR